MMKRYFMALAAGLMTLGSQAQEYTVVQDMTSKLTNANFKADTPVAGTVTTYDYNHSEVALGEFCLFGQQAVTGWTSNFPSDNIKQLNSSADPAREDGANACAAGVFAYSTDGMSTTGLGGDYFPNIDGGDVQGLGIVSVWGHNLQYSQSISLTKGDYLLIARLCNISGDGTVTNNFGFRIDAENYYRSSMTTFPLTATLEAEGKDIWVEDTVFMRLTADVTGDVVLGYTFGNGSGSAPHIFIDNVCLLQVDPSTHDKIIVDEAKVTLKALIDRGQRLGVDTSASEAVYNNPNATLAQVEAAIDKQKEINDSAITDLSEFFIVNPHFSQDEPITDGICTYEYDMASNNVTHFGMQPVKSWVASNPSDNVTTGNEDMRGRACGVFETGSEAFIGGKGFLPPPALSDGSQGKVLGFVTCWGKTTQYTQHVSLPAGSFTLTISYYNSGGANAIKKNLIGFIADDGTEYLGETMTFPVGQWGEETISFTLDAETEGNFTLGYTGDGYSSNLPHFFLDGISLIYEGELEFDPSLLALQGAVNNAENYEVETFNADLLGQLEDAISEARALINAQSADTEANKAAQEKITAMIQEVQASIEAYKRLENFYNVDLNNAQQKYSYITELIDLDDEVSAALSDCNWDNAKIDEVIASLPTIVKTAVQQRWDEAIASGAQLDEDLNISPLFDTLGVTYSTTAQSGTNVPDKQWQYGSASNFKTQYGTAEVWNQSPFTVSQTIADMPAGTYTITTRAFYRTSDNATNYSNYDSTSHYAYVFAGSNRAPLTNVVEVGSAEEVAGWADAGGLFVPNSQEAAHNVFESEDYVSVVTSSTQTVLSDTGDLTFGITADEMEGNCWVVWYTFEIAYNAINNDVLAQELQALIERAEEAYGSYEAERVIATGEALETAIGEGQSALDNADPEQMKTAMSLLSDAIAAKDLSYELINKFDELVVAYGDLYQGFEFTSSDTEFIRIIEDRAESEFESNEEIQQLIDRLPVAFFNYVVKRDDFAEGTEDNPIDLTDIIMNADFTSGNSNYWTITADETSEDGRIGQNQGYQSSSYENDDVIISQFIEAWRPNGAILNDGTISQTLNGVLPKGYYRLEIDGYATNQASVPEEGITGVELFAQIGANVSSTPIGIAETTGKPQHFVCDFYSDGTNPATIGIMVNGTNASWVAADNFQLSYIGQETPVAVESMAAATDAPAAVYNLAGVRVKTAQKGLNIIVRDGKAQKVLVK